MLTNEAHGADKRVLLRITPEDGRTIAGFRIDVNRSTVAVQDDDDGMRTVQIRRNLHIVDSLVPPIAYGLYSAFSENIPL